MRRARSPSFINTDAQKLATLSIIQPNDESSTTNPSLIEPPLSPATITAISLPNPQADTPINAPKSSWMDTEENDQEDMDVDHKYMLPVHSFWNTWLSNEEQQVFSLIN